MSTYTIYSHLDVVTLLFLEPPQLHHQLPLWKSLSPTLHFPLAQTWVVTLKDCFCHLHTRKSTTYSVCLFVGSEI